ncbi:suppressor of fused domain protein [Psychrobacillus sp. NPDC093180]|uniref:suppressor of fused domain protein n=1 Tax=Psychrobacillus sp. NPDC093180 TaxID=3364489 RepID=UPI0037FC3D16
MESKQVALEIRSAIKKGNTEKVVELIGSNAGSLNTMTPFGTWLHVAASKGELDIVKKLLELGLYINMLGGVYGGGALNEAASAGYIDVVRYLLAYGAELDVSEPERNPLFGAISNGHVEIANLLIESGIDTDIKYSGESKKNMDALTFAKEQGQEEIMKLLEDKKGFSTTTTAKDNSKDHQDKILEHLVKHIGNIKNTISETVPGSRVSVNIHIIPPSINKEFITLVTTGMSDEPMIFTEKENELKYAELLLKLPSSWKVEEDNLNDQNNGWPFRWLRKVAHIPHIYDGWLEEGVILPNGEPPQPFASDTKLSSILVCRPQETELENLNTKQGKVHFYSLVPIYDEERSVALEKGHGYLLEKMREKGISDILDISRVNVGI